jgi:hypothetical protein
MKKVMIALCLLAACQHDRGPHYVGEPNDTFYVVSQDTKGGGHDSVRLIVTGMKRLEVINMRQWEHAPAWYRAAIHANGPHGPVVVSYCDTSRHNGCVFLHMPADSIRYYDSLMNQPGGSWVPDKGALSHK